MSWQGKEELGEEWADEAYSFVRSEVSDKLHFFMKEFVDQASGHASNYLGGDYTPSYGDEEVWRLVKEEILAELGVKETK
jgi:hypothetical protein